MNDQNQSRNDENSSTNPGQLAENHKVGRQLAREDATPSSAGQTAGENARPNTSPTTPNYDEFGQAQTGAAWASEAEAPLGATNSITSAPGAPTTPAPGQRGASPQNLAPGAVRMAQDESEENARAAFEADDPRYGSGTRNWATNEPANRSTGPASDDDGQD
ncbi:hypothetical protein LJY25_19375 [Hymenobacter sp. BT175]|uniref:hypothetical protein n=1 Tax=Hymenobacter translucens TaxID=2886507 RepID=UPI001D0E2A89|nr:hypothetical protein [Hymenobacter translucens]MCC2548618.1 hypothetical protein [Hymenobacter translucens]